MPMPTLAQIIGTITGKVAFERTQANFTTIKDAHNGLETNLETHKAEKASDINRPHGLGRVAKEDYEVGTFTPIIKFGGGSDGITYSRQIGTYTKIGRTINFDIDVILTNKGTSKGSASIGGLPFAKSVQPPYGVYYSECNKIVIPPDIVQIGANHNGGTEILYPRFVKSSSVITPGTDEHFDNGTAFRISGTYTI